MNRNHQTISSAAWVGQVVSGQGMGLDDHDLCELATEATGGSLATINGLLEGLALRHGDDTATLAALAAIRHYHLPMLLDALGE